MQSGSRFVNSLHRFSKTNFKSTLFYPRKNTGFSSFSSPLYHTKTLTTFSFANYNSKLINQFSYSTNATHHHKIAQAEVLHIDTAPPITPNEISNTAFPDHVLSELSKGFDENEVEIKPDGIIYLPEIKYRRVLNNAFGAGGWVMIPRGAPAVRGDVLYREYAMYCYGKFVSQAVGEQQIHRSMSEGTAVEASKSNSLMRCCKDLGIASELWDPNFIEGWKSTYAMQVWCKNEKTGELKLMWRRKDRNTIPYPWKEQNPVATTKKYSPLRISPSNSPPQPTYQTSPSQTERKPSYAKSQPQSASKQKAVYGEIEEENVDVEGEQVQVDDVQEEDLPDEFDANEIVPAELKRFQGKTWDELFASPEGIQYLNWASKHPKLGEEPKQKVQSALDWYSKSYPPQVE